MSCEKVMTSSMVVVIEEPSFRVCIAKKPQLKFIKLDEDDSLKLFEFLKEGLKKRGKIT